MRSLAILLSGCLVLGAASSAYAANTACRSDVQKFCGGRVQNRTAACLVDNMDQLQPACREAVKKAQENNS